MEHLHTTIYDQMEDREASVINTEVESSGEMLDQAHMAINSMIGSEDC